MSLRPQLRSSALDEVGDQMAEPGSRAWAIYFVRRAKKKRYDLESDAKSLRELLDDLESGGAWKPLGLASFNMLCELEVGLLPEQVDAIRSAQPGATVGAALGGHGGDHKSKEFRNQIDNVKLIHDGGNDSSYLAARLERDHPDIKAQLDAGAFRSVRQAALKAGIVEPSFQCPKDLEKAATRLKRHFDGDRLKQLIDLLTR